MRQFASTVATLVGGDEDGPSTVDRTAFAERLHAVFANLAERKPDIAAYLLEERVHNQLFSIIFGEREGNLFACSLEF